MKTKKIQLAINSIGLDCSIEQSEKLCRFYEIILEKNKVMNLTRITDFDAYVIKHVLDSLSAVLLNNASCDILSILNKTSSEVLDLGTGAGFPGIPLAVIYDKSHFTLLDSLNKRVRFLDDVVANLSLNNVFPLHGRAEELAIKSEYREKFKLCLSRAVANLSTLSEYAIPFVETGGHFISYKGGEADEEIKASERALKTLGAKTAQVYKFTLPEIEGISKQENTGRTLVDIVKIKNTPKKYPRQAGIPKKNPL